MAWIKIKQEEKKNYKILLLLFIGILMGALDISIVAPAIPSIEQTIKIAERDLGWIVSIYILFNLMGITLFAKLSDIYGRRAIYILSIIIFAIGSVFVVFANSFAILLLGRAIQGFGSSGIFPVATAVIGDVFPPEKRGSALGLIGTVFGFAFILGPLIAGILLIYYDWNLLFLINLPIAVVLVYYSWKLLPNKKIKDGEKIDILGLVILGCMLASFAFGLSQIRQDDFYHSFFSVEVFPFIIFSLLLLISFIYIEKRAKNPVVKLALFKIKQIKIVSILAINAGLTQSFVIFIPKYSIILFNVEKSSASFMLLPLVISSAIASPLIGKMLDIFGSRLIVILGMVLVLIGMSSLILTNDNTLQFYLSGIPFGFGLTMLMSSPLRYIMLNEVEPQDRALTQGILTIFISLGQIVGAAIIPAMIVLDQNGVIGYHTAMFSLIIINALLIVIATMLKNRSQEIETMQKSRS